MKLRFNTSSCFGEKHKKPRNYRVKVLLPVEVTIFENFDTIIYIYYIIYTFYT